MAKTKAKPAVKAVKKTAKPATKKAAKQKFVYYFGGKKAEGRADMKNLLGGKGANLAEMVNLGFPVPPGFTITTEVCNYFYSQNHKLPTDLDEQIKKAVLRIHNRIFTDHFWSYKSYSNKDYISISTERYLRLKNTSLKSIPL